MPRPKGFARPFVEDVNIIREWDGESAGDQFGWIARVIGDVDGDGMNDFVTSAPTKNLGGADAGRIYVYSGQNEEHSSGASTVCRAISSAAVSKRRAM